MSLVEVVDFSSIVGIGAINVAVVEMLDSLASLSSRILHSQCGDLLFSFIIAFPSLTTEKVGIPAPLCAAPISR